ncbi:MAG: hypothetical protein HYY10_03935 [Candidatus Liptonbacteria bacterium]|nr:hypothetical protein [Candidatus Liptonbacteria bacterium]
MNRFNPSPEPCARADKKMNQDLYNYMWGPKEFRIAGTLRDFDPTSRLSEILVPVLLLCGRYDEATPQTCEYFRSLIPDARLTIFEDSAHLPVWSEQQKYVETIRKFLTEVETGQFTISPK